MKTNQNFSPYLGFNSKNPLTFGLSVFAVVFLMGSALRVEAASFLEKVKKPFILKSRVEFVTFTIPFRGDDVVVKLPSDGDVAYREAVSMIKNGVDFPAAENSLKTFVQSQPAFSPGWLALGLAQEIQGSLKDALTSYIKADADKNEKVREEAAAGIARVKQLARFKGIAL